MQNPTPKWGRISTVLSLEQLPIRNKLCTVRYTVAKQQVQLCAKPTLVNRLYCVAV